MTGKGNSTKVLVINTPKFGLKITIAGLYLRISKTELHIKHFDQTVDGDCYNLWSSMDRLTLKLLQLKPN